MASRSNLASVEFGSKAVRDLRKLAKSNREDAEKIRDALEDLSSGASNLDIKQLQGHPPWRRLRVGDWRVLYRELSAEEIAELRKARRERAGSTRAAARKGWLVFRIVNRKELERAAATLP
jgi:addiction module RelE/StbE family toxin